MSMQIQELHAWPTKEDEATRIQQTLVPHVRLTSLPELVQNVAGVDTAYNPTLDRLYAAVCVYSLPNFNIIDTAKASAEAEFPYVPGLHIFREGPVILKALRRLTIEPDVIIFAGHGIAHSMRFGMASHMGVMLDCPTIGCARKCLAGQFNEVGQAQGDLSELVLGNEPVGVVYRSRENVKPIFISPGHLCTISDAKRIIVECLRGYRIPEPLRAAHRIANREKRDK